MKNEKNETEGASESAQPKKLLLGKRVLRHFNVRTSIQTGQKNSVVDTNPTSNPDPTLDPSDDSGSKSDGTYSGQQRCR